MQGPALGALLLRYDTPTVAGRRSVAQVMTLTPPYARARGLRLVPGDVASVAIIEVSTARSRPQSRRSPTRPTLSGACASTTAGMVSPAKDRNVAEAWATWLLREDDSPVTFLDHMMNGLGFGAVFGSGFDVLAFLLFKTTGYNASRGTYGWTRTGMKFGFVGGLTTYAAATYSSRSSQAEARIKESSSSSSSSSNRSSSRPNAEHVRDPWAPDQSQSRNAN